MPILTFWMLHRNVDRLQADENRHRALSTAAGMSGEGLTTYLEKQVELVGKVIEIDVAKAAMSEERDRAGLLALKGDNKG